MERKEFEEIKVKADNYTRGRYMSLSFKPLTINDIKEAYLCGAMDYEQMMLANDKRLHDDRSR